jgi:hypothetical protein
MAPYEFSSSARERSDPRWRMAYETALQETDRETLFKRIEVAEAAVLARRDVLAQSADGFAERREITLAIAKLESLKKEVLKFL